MMERAEAYDAVVVGGSFAGLAAASQLSGVGKILLLDREPIGSGETSACGTPVAVLRNLRAHDALERVCGDIVVHVDRREVVLRRFFPFATFDYRTFCEIMASRLEGVEIALGTCDGVDEDGTLLIGARRVRTPVLIDATGWRHVAASALGVEKVDRSRLSFGLELRVPKSGEDLEFWFRPSGLDDGVRWSFPAHEHARVGSASYVGRTKGLGSDLANFRQINDLPARAIHGGFFPSHLARSVVGSAFVVGDAAGHCLPLTGEGIRPALVFGQEAGRQARAVIEGRLSLQAALANYQYVVERSRRVYRSLERCQALSIGWPLGLVGVIARGLASTVALSQLEKYYWRVASPSTLTVAPGVSPASLRQLNNDVDLEPFGAL